ncbi:MAG: AAA family ATPase [Gammaproteobacteria bacterium]|nr:AAA family ATPase [Gammaproteobacteria bacterium]NIN62632.1 AAA family ATPase [Gammaproteobacteria bacterium]NIO63169.1 AAA family ATPase [Gammaproteobacteria bacterium]NIQ20270.1 AAA family ATPase [Gammaproteobacteria bacterium]NIT06461.1 AAA family ATPase [Gammaproteobacteria bacterium]
MMDLNDLEVLLKSSVPMIRIESREENRIIGLFERVITRLTRPFYRWSVTEGLKRMDVDKPAQLHNNKPLELLTQIKMTRHAGVYLLLDFHPFLEEPVNIRLLKDIAQQHVDVPHTLVFISHEVNLPAELDHYCVPYEMALPGVGKIEEIIRKEARAWSRLNQDLRIVVEKDLLQQLINSVSGLPVDDVSRLIRSAIRNDGVLTHSDLSEITQAKFKLLNLSGVLSFEYDMAEFAEVGGLINLKKWLAMRKEIFTTSESAPGLDPPKGMLLLGVQGCGKSLAAKAVAGNWGVPLLRLDFGTLYNKYHGETEKNLRESLKTAEVMAPCVLWIDEIEKGISLGDNDGGVSRRILGTLLTWMAEKKQNVFIVATANDIHALPPELLRKGRFDEIFFVDLPDAETRELIFRIHLEKRAQDPKKFNLKSLAEKSPGFSGSEIEQAVVSSLYRAYAGKENLSDTEIIRELKMTKPLSVVMAEQIAALREWASDRTVRAN